MARIDELTDEQSTEFGHALLRWITDQDPAHVARLFPSLDPHAATDAEAAELGRFVLEDLIAERFVTEGSA